MATISDDFNRADSTNLGASWTEVEGDLQIVDNKVRAVTVAQRSTIRHTSVLDSNDHAAQLELVSLMAAASRLTLVACRFSASALTFYAFRRLHDGTNYVHRLEKSIGGATTVIAGPTIEAFTAGEVLKVQAVGSTIKAFIDGVEKHSVTDTDIPAGTRAGLLVFSGGAGPVSDVQVDGFSAADILAELPGGRWGRVPIL